jgi:hypothetical protein
MGGHRRVDAQKLILKFARVHVEMKVRYFLIRTRSNRMPHADSITREHTIQRSRYARHCVNYSVGCRIVSVSQIAHVLPRHYKDMSRMKLPYIHE